MSQEVFTSEQDYYGNEAERFEALRAMQYPEFKDWIIQVRNSHADLEEVNDFVAQPNSTLGGKLYPRHEDKDYLLEYTLKQAQAAQDLQTAALIVGIGIIFTHPFTDGNGRTSREIYGYISRGIDPTSLEYAALRKSSIVNDKPVDFSLIDSYGHELLHHAIFTDNDVEQTVFNAKSDQNYNEYKPYSNEVLEGLTDAEKEMLKIVIEHAGKRNLIYAISKIEQEGANIIKKDTGEHVVALFDETFESLTLEQKRALITYSRDYHTLRAKAAIDLVSVHGHKRVGNMTVKDIIVSITSNYVASKIKLKSK